MTTTSPQDILSRLRADDQSALQLLFNQYYAALCRTIHRYIQDQALTEDLAQNVFVRFWEKRQTLEISSSLEGYLHRMAMNEALMHLRKLKRRGEAELIENAVTQTTESVEDNYLQGELEEQISRAIDNLPPRTRLVFRLSRFEQMTYKAIAKELEISVKTVENQMVRALRILREQMKKYK